MPRRLFVAVFTLAVGLGQVHPTAQPPTLFTFHSNAWLNLHFFLRDQARGAPAPAGLIDSERIVWTEGVESYRPYATRDLMDGGMIAIKNALRTAEGRPSLDGVAIDPALRVTLERVMPVYLQRFWTDHDGANRQWIVEAQPLVDRYAPAIAQAMARVYEITWPASGVPVDVSVIGGLNGAYTTTNPTHVIMPSRNERFRNEVLVEMLFHEASHAWAGLSAAVTAAARTANVTVPPQLWHGVLFHTAGELTRRELATRGIDYVEYATRYNVYVNLCGADCRDKIAGPWGQRLDGARTREQALADIVARFR